MKTDTLIETIETKAEEYLEKITIQATYGKIIRIEDDEIWIDFDNNPDTTPVIAKLGCLHISFDELEKSVELVESVKIDFEDGDTQKPVIRDIFCSISKLREQNDEEINLTAKKIVLNAETEIQLTCGNSTVVLNKKEIFNESDNLVSTSRNSNRIMGADIQLN
ncbi:MAG: hypothetical protein GY714_33020 [Desulfobacterales bacterium]|nr:hypothetical protein [Desulfobacterales bacterium]